MSDDADDVDLEERCGAETRDGTPCEKYPVAGGTRCRFHGGASTGPRDPSALEANDHAAGNDGGAPEGNTNALRTGAFVPLDRIPERLDVEQLHGVARWEWWAILASRRRRPDLDEDRRRRLAARWARLDVRHTTATVDTFTDLGRGFLVERERTVETAAGDEVTVTERVSNPCLGVQVRTRAEQRDVAEALGISAAADGPVPEASRRAAPPLPDPVERMREQAGGDP